MRIHRSTTPNDARGATAAIGNFDGVHLGHQAILSAAANAISAPLGVVTFEPHPREYFAKDAPPFRLMSPAAKANRLESLGVSHLYEIAFDTELAALSPRDFAKQVIVDRLGLAHVTVGTDFRFGNGRAGTGETLIQLGDELGFGVTVAPLVETGGLDVSSTRIREALSNGDPRTAAAMLGHLHRIDGPVIHGEKRGRELGYPTANMSLAGLHLPRFGVYAVQIEVRTGPYTGSYQGVASLGVRPMFGENLPNLETFIFDFSGDLYGAEVSVALVAFLRGEETFDSLDSLITQMDADSAEARRQLAQ